MVTDEELAWRPGPGHSTLGQQLFPIAQSEDFNIQGILRGDWDLERARFPARSLKVDELRARLKETRERTLAALGELDEGRLEASAEGMGESGRRLRWWLWLLVEHEVHHKAQIAVYLRQMGRTPPFFAEAREDGARPDIEAREKMGGF